MFAHLRQAQPVLQLAFRAQTGTSAWDRSPLAAVRRLAGSILQCSTRIICAEAERLVREAAGVSLNVDRRALCLVARSYVLWRLWERNDLTCCFPAGDLGVLKT